MTHSRETQREGDEGTWLTQLTISCWILTEPHFATMSGHLDKARRSARNRILRRRQLFVGAQGGAGMATVL